MNTIERYFVTYLRDNECKDINKPFEIQILDEIGQCIAVSYLSSEQEELIIEGKQIPNAVIQAAKKQPIGKGDYVNECGKSIFPF